MGTKQRLIEGALQATSALEALERLAVLADVVEDLGPVARRALRSRTA